MIAAVMTGLMSGLVAMATIDGAIEDMSGIVFIGVVVAVIMLFVIACSSAQGRMK